MKSGVTVLGVFVADATFRSARVPEPGETVLANSVAVGPGGKGSNQAIAAGKLGGTVRILTRLGDDAFAEIGFDAWSAAGVEPHVIQNAMMQTGAASILVNEQNGENAITICPGAAGAISEADIEGWAEEIKGAAVFMTQLEQPLQAARWALQLARDAGVITVLNPAPATMLPDDLLSLVDILTPNEHEAAALTDLPVGSLDEARFAADALLARGVGTVAMTLGADGALLHNAQGSDLVPAHNAGTVVDTTGAGDAFNGALAHALASGRDLKTAVELGCIVAGLSVTRPGAAASSPSRDEVLALVAEQDML